MPGWYFLSMKSSHLIFFIHGKTKKVNIWEGKGEKYILRRHYWQYIMLVSEPKMRKHMRIDFIQPRSTCIERKYGFLGPSAAGDRSADWCPLSAFMVIGHQSVIFWKLPSLITRGQPHWESSSSHLTAEWNTSGWKLVKRLKCRHHLYYACVVSAIYQSILVSTSL